MLLVSILHCRPIIPLVESQLLRSKAKIGLIGVIAKCRKYVNPVIIRDDDRGLLEILEGNNTDLVGLSASIAAAEAAELIDSEPDPSMPTNPPLTAVLENGGIPISIGDSLPPAE